MKRSRVAAAIVFGALAACSAASGPSAGAPNDETSDGGTSGSDAGIDAPDAHDGAGDGSNANDADAANDAHAAKDAHVGDASDAASDADASPPVATVRKKYLDYSVLLGGPVRTPSAAFVKAHLADVEKRPFDGIVLTPVDGAYLYLLDTAAWTDASIDRDTLTHVGFQKLTENFVVLIGTDRFGLDWSDDAAWATIEANLELLAAALRDGGFKGVFFDPEPYVDPNQWTWSDAKFGKPFADVAATYRKRGQTFVTALQKPMPNVVLMSAFFARMAHDYVWGTGDVTTSKYGLLLAFLAGILDGLGPAATLVDGNENAYYYTHTSDWFDGVQKLADVHVLYQGDGLPGAFDAFPDAAALEATYRARMKIGMSVYVEQPIDKGYADLAKYWEQATYTGLVTSDEWVWCYSESVDWYGQTTGYVPAGLSDASVAARGKIEALAPLGYEMTDADAYAPTALVSLSSPEANEVLASPAKVSAMVTFPGNETYAGLAYHANGRLLGTSSASPFDLAPTAVSPGSFWLVARASGPSTTGASPLVPIVVTPLRSTHATEPRSIEVRCARDRNAG